MRTAGAKREVTEQAIYSAGVELIARFGYEGMTLRMLAEEVNMKAGSLYNYFSNKQDLLTLIMKTVLRDLLFEFTERVDFQANTLDRFRAMVSVHLQFHTRRRHEVFIGNMELRSLDKENYDLITRLRSDYERRVRLLIDDGVKEGIFAVDDSNLTTKALISMLTGICNWYMPDGRLSIKELEKTYTDLALSLVKHPPSG